MPAMPQSRKKTSERLDIRIPSSKKRLIEKAAEIRGTSVTQFVTSIAEQEAERAIRESEVLVLRGAAKDAFIEAFLNPREPSDTLKAAVARYKARVNEPSGGER